MEHRNEYNQLMIFVTYADNDDNHADHHDYDSDYDDED